LGVFPAEAEQQCSVCVILFLDIVAGDLFTPALCIALEYHEIHLETFRLRWFKSEFLVPFVTGIHSKQLMYSKKYLPTVYSMNYRLFALWNHKCKY